MKLENRLFPPHPTIIWRPRSGESVRISGWNLYRKSTTKLWQRSDLRDLDLGSSHMTYFRVAIIDLCLQPNFVQIGNLFVDRRTYGRTERQRVSHIHCRAITAHGVRALTRLPVFIDGTRPTWLYSVIFIQSTKLLRYIWKQACSWCVGVASHVGVRH